MNLLIYIVVEIDHFFFGFFFNIMSLEGVAQHGMLFIICDLSIIFGKIVEAFFVPMAFLMVCYSVLILLGYNPK